MKNSKYRCNLCGEDIEYKKRIGKENGMVKLKKKYLHNYWDGEHVRSCEFSEDIHLHSTCFDKVVKMIQAYDALKIEKEDKLNN